MAYHAFKHKGVLVLGAATLFFVLLMLLAPELPIIEPDSASYINFASFRSAGYPLFLDVVGVGRATVVAQSLLAAAALAYLGAEMASLSGSVIAAMVLMGAIAVNGPLDVYHFEIMSESLFVSLLMVVLGLLMRLSRLNSPWVAVLVSVVAGVAITVRPAGWFLLPLMVLSAFVLGGRRRKTLVLLLALVGPLLAVASLERGYSALRFGNQAGSTLMRQIYGKAGLIDAPATGSTVPAAVVLEKDFAQVRALIARAPDFAVESFFSLNYEVCLEFTCSRMLGIDPNEPAAKAAALARIAANPSGFAALAWRNYRDMWTVYGISHPAEGPVLDVFLRANRPLPFESQVPVLTAKVTPTSWARFVQPAVQAIGFLTGGLAMVALAALALRQRLPPLVACAGLAALAVHGGTMLVALTGVGILRYLLALWPAMMVALVCSGWWGLGRLCSSGAATEGG